jgi:flavin reductase (DIM6/NTAB) family NADH-FMN oxidoreductase RutF/rubredoxin
VKKWRCKVCGYEHSGDTPPDICPICGVGPEDFMVVTAASDLKPDDHNGNQWKCTVCDYIHNEAAPPEVCPICGVGPDKFVLITILAGALTEKKIAAADEGTSRAALEKIGYGLYVVTSKDGNKINGQCANTVFQITSQPPIIAVGINKRNLTHEYVLKSGVLAISILRDSDIAAVRNFGFSSGRDRNKFEGVEFLIGREGCPILKDCVAYFEARVILEKIVDVGTHSLIIAEIISGGLVDDAECLTYDLYRKLKSGNK